MILQIRDYCGDVLDGGFYEEEIQLVQPPEFFEIERILETKKERGKTKHFVKWSYYPDCANSWVDANNTKNI